MRESENILISLEPRFAESILTGAKRVELRRRSMNIAFGATVWMYAKLPVGSVVGKARIKMLHSEAPKTLWRKYGAVSGISKEEFFDYFNGVSLGVALELVDAVRLNRAIPLNDLRERDERFHPPQFFARMRSNHPLLSALAA
jgi:predicted transcriptional regulator